MGYTPRSRWLGSLALIAAGSLVLTACGGSTSTSTSTSSAASSAAGAASDSESSPAAVSGGVVTAIGSEPQNPLIPTNTNETGGGDIVDLIFAGLIYYDKDGVPQNEMAESIESTDGQNYTIKIKPGWKFTNGEDVTAQSYVDAWNYGALITNAQLSSYFFEPIEGYDAVNNCDEGAGPPDEEGVPTCLPAPLAETMSGLKVVSDTEFTVKLVSPQSDFPLRLGYSAYVPMAKAALADVEKFGEEPASNGPYMVKKWDHNAQIELVPNPDYKGGRTPQNAGVTLKFYTSIDAAYADLLSDNLDVLDTIPAASLGSFETDLGDRAIKQAGSVFQSFIIPSSLPHFSGEEGDLRRQALSRAIDRETITQVIFNGTRSPAKDFTSPVIDGFKEDLPGSEVLTYDEQIAKDLWAQADAISPFDGTLELSYNQNGGHKEWVEAVVNGWKNVLGDHFAPKEFAVFGEFRAAITDRTIGTAFRTGWQPDYPSVFNYLAPLYYTGAGSNDGDYSSPEFDKLMDEGAAAATPEEGIAKFQQAEEVLLKDLPAVPLWYSGITGGYSSAVDNVNFGWNNRPLLHEVTKA